MHTLIDKNPFDQCKRLEIFLNKNLRQEINVNLLSTCTAEKQFTVKAFYETEASLSEAFRFMFKFFVKYFHLTLVTAICQTSSERESAKHKLENEIEN